MSINIIRSAVRATGGTQVSEYAAAIKSVTSSTTVGAVFLYDTSQDSDSGKWRKKCKGLSWFDEGSSTTRSARSEFPAMALIVADNVGTAQTLTVYDLDDVAAPLFFQFTANGASGANSFWCADRDASSVYALNGRIYVGLNAVSESSGLVVFDFANDKLERVHSSSTRGGVYHGIADRANGVTLTGTVTPIVSGTVNDVAATWLEGGELDSMGLVRPVVACATAGGVSVIHPSGDVYDVYGSQTHADRVHVFCTEDGMVGQSFQASGSSQIPFGVRIDPIPFADDPVGSSYQGGVERYNPPVISNYFGLITNTNGYNATNATVNAVTPMSGDGLAIGYPDRLSIVKRNTGNDTEGAVAYITSTYNTGYMLGDIRGAWLANPSSTTDRSVKGNHLTPNGTITTGFVATDAELKYYDGFSASNYFSRAYDADFDFGTGDFSITIWAKWTASGSASQYIVDRGSAGAERFYLYDASSGGKPIFYVTDDASGGGSDSSITTTNTYNDGNWHQIVAVRRNSKLAMYVDGVDAGIAHATSAQNLDNSSAYLRVGVSYVNDLPFNGSLSLFRISATAPTPKQIADIYAAEKPLFAAGAKCLLQSDHGSVSNEVKDLAFDKSTGLLTVAQSTVTNSAGVQKFRGLEMVETFDGSSHGWNEGDSTIVATAGGVGSYARTGGNGGVLVDLPALDVRAELLEGESKLPDDGKFHFEGVTTDATPTVIGFVPIQQNEDYLVRLAVNGKRYQVHESSYFIDGRIEERFFRRLGGSDVETSGETLKLVNEGQAALDFDLTVSTGGSDSPASVAASAGYIMLRVTGAAGTRIVWKASVEVQRISEKLYER